VPHQQPSTKPSYTWKNLSKSDGTTALHIHYKCDLDANLPWNLRHYQRIANRNHAL